MGVMLNFAETGNSPVDFNRLSEGEQAVLVDWIARKLQPAKQLNAYRTSYGLKHIFEESPEGFYVTNGQFKGAMVAAGYMPVDESALNWRFYLSERAVKRAHTEAYGPPPTNPYRTRGRR